MGRYLKQKMADTLLCAVVTASLVPVICSGFVLTDPWSQSMAMIIVCSIVLQALFALLARRRVTIWLGVCMGAVIAIAVFAYMRVTNPLSDETSNSTFIFALIQIITPLLVFLLSRSRLGLVTLFLIGNLICAGCHFLQYPAPAWCLYIFLAAVVILFFHRVCTVSAEKAELGSISPQKYLRQIIVFCVGGLALALGIYYCIVAPLNPPTQELKLITELRSMELMQVLGISSTEVILDPNMTADVPPEETEQSNQRGEEESDALDGQDETRPGEMPDFSEELQETISSALQQAASAIRYDSASFSWLGLLLLIPVAVIAAYVLRFVLKERWRKQVQTLPREDAVVNYYRFFLSRLGRMGLKKQPDHTLREFTQHIKAQLEPFESNNIHFVQLTDTYEKVLYGRHRVSEEEYDRFERFYDTFHRAMRREIGTLKYYLKAFMY